MGTRKTGGKHVSAAPVSFEKSSSLHETHNEYICNSRRHVILHSFLRRGISCPAAIAAHIAATRSKGPREARAAASQSGMSFMALWKARSEGVSPGQPRHAPPSTACADRSLPGGAAGHGWHSHAGCQPGRGRSAPAGSGLGRSTDNRRALAATADAPPAESDLGSATPAPFRTAVRVGFYPKTRAVQSGGCRPPALAAAQPHNA